MPHPAIAARDLAGRRILITGASSGLGAHFAETLAAAGAQVALAARRADRLEALAGRITAGGGKAVAVAMDVQDEASVIAGFDAAEAALGPIDVALANAGMNSRGASVEISAADFDQVFAINVRGAFLTAREAARRMMRRADPPPDGGRIIVVASIGGLKVLPGLTPYCMSKAALVMMTRALAREWARRDICVNAICPGYVETELNAEWLSAEGGQRMVQGFPRRRLMRAQDMDDTLLFLAGPRSAYVTGSIFTLDDGQSI